MQQGRRNILDVTNFAAHKKLSFKNITKLLDTQKFSYIEHSDICNYTRL